MNRRQSDMSVVDPHEFLADPEVRRKALEDYQKAGFLIFRRVFSDAEVAGMRDTWTDIDEGRRQDGKKPHATLLMSHLSNAAVAGVVRNPVLVDCVQSVLGGKIDLIQSQLMFGPPGAKGFSPHQDNFYNRAEPSGGILAAWIAVEDVDPQNGCLAVFPGSHVNGLAKTRRDWIYLLSRSPDVARSLLRLVSPWTRGQPNDSGVVERYTYSETPQDIEPVPVAMERGSVVFMHGDLIHFSYPNQTKDRFRRSLVANYVRVGTHFTTGLLAGRMPFDVYAH